MTVIEGTGKFVTEKEKFLMIQLFGDAQKLKDDAHIQRSNLYLQILADKYEYDWSKHQVNPETGEIMTICENCDEKLGSENVRIEE